MNKQRLVQNLMQGSNPPPRNPRGPFGPNADGYPYRLPQPAGAITYQLNGQQVGRGNILNIVQPGATAEASGDKVTYNLTGGGGGGGVVIGAPVTGGTPDRIMYIDAAGNVAQSSDLVWAQASKTFLVGDPNNTGNGTTLQVSDSGQNIELSAGLVSFTGAAQIGIFGRVNSSSRTIQWGDITPVGNSTVLFVDDSISRIGNVTGGDYIIQSVIGQQFFNVNTATRVGQLGDVGNAVNGTILIVNDTAQIITASAQPGGVGTQVRVATNFADMKYSSGAATWGFEASNTAGGASRITANNVTWIWPNSDTAGSLVSDGAGNLSFSPTAGLVGTPTFIPFFDVTTGNLTWNGDISFNQTTKIFSVGDVTSTGNDTVFTVDDSLSQIEMTLDNLLLVHNTSNEASFTLNPSTFGISMGDLSLVGNGTQFHVNDGTSSITAQSTGTVNLGDMASTGNDTKLELDDTTQTVVLTAGLGFAVKDPAGNFWYQLIPGFHQQSMGDASSAFNHTLFIVDDIARIINSNAILAGVGGHALTAAGGSKIEYVNAGTNWGFNASNSGGGAAIITANNQNYKWPDTDGTTGNFLVTDGSGVLSFQTLTPYASDAAAGVGGLVAGEMYQTDGGGVGVFAELGVVMVKQ